jgi:cellulose synthase/poly-beta-1,6-N-acetylglucosamine synthase-like glycosyltransferase
MSEAYFVVPALFWASLALVGYVWAGYPLLVALLARLRPRESWEEAAQPPSVTLIIAAWNEEEIIARRLDDALELDYPRDRLQILVAAEASPDRTLEVVRAYEHRGVELSTARVRSGKSAALSRALAAARGEVVAFSDANNTWDARALRHLVAPFTDSRVGATVGSKRVAVPSAGSGHVASGSTLYWRYEDFLCRQESRLGGCLAAAGEILAVRRVLIPEIPPDTVNDDFFLVLAVARRGYRVVYVPAAISIERTTPAAGEERERRARITAGRVRHVGDLAALVASRRLLVAWQLLSHKLLRLALPWALLGMLATSVAALAAPRAARGGGLLLLAPPWNWLALGGQLAFYAVAASADRLPRGSRARRLAAVLRYLVEANLATARGMVRGLARRQTALWPKASRQRGA